MATDTPALPATASPPAFKPVRPLPPSLILVAVVPALATLADLLFYDCYIGWTLGLFGLLLLVGLAVANRHLLDTWIGRLFFCANLGLCLAMIEQPSALAIGLYAIGFLTLAMAD